ncbi:hypothetical protein [Streptomyces sp. TP-A0356]|uniref:hypothetical protein n=1 Tax=Streptomyces sp. TP-A0356 TaxID=1359208 RepID=UPI0006E26B8B|nr:hypothetical protein [Streptomyces sp. TP-A0356]
MSRPRRVAVVSPQTRLALARRSAAGRHLVLPPDFDAHAARRAYLRQRRLAALTVLALAILLLALPLLIATVPQLGMVRLAGIPLSWLLVGVFLYPLLLLAALILLRRAERAERTR